MAPEQMMSALETFHFLRPLWLLALLPVALMLWVRIRTQTSQGGWESQCDSALLPYILTGRADGHRSTHPLRQIALTTAALLGIIALAGPTWERLAQPLYRSASPLVIILDLSLSMYAEDVSPNRLERAKFELSDLITARRGGEVALIVYAGDAFTVTPLTDDTETIRLQMPALTPAIMPLFGSDTSRALELASQLVEQAGSASADIILITDGVDIDQHRESFTLLAKRGFRTSILAVGTPSGGPVTLPKGGFLTDGSGAIVIPKLSEATLQQLAALGGGVFIRSRDDDLDTQQLQRLTSHRPEQVGNDSGYQSDQWREFGPWLLLILLPLAASGFRRGLLMLPLLLMLPSHSPLHALEWQSLWLSQDQQAKAYLDKGDAAAAAPLFSDSEWQASAYYRAGEYQKAEQLWGHQETTRSLYNRANALAKLGHLQEAIDGYDQVLGREPTHSDAQFNRQLLQQLIDQQKQQQQKDTSDSSQEGDSKESQPNQDGDSDRSKAADDTPGGQTTPPSAASDSGEQRADAKASQGDEETTEQGQPASEQRGDPAPPQGGHKEQPEGSEQGQQMAEESDGSPVDEATLATEQWLRRLPDDPSALLRRKFQYQLRERGNRTTQQGNHW